MQRKHNELSLHSSDRSIQIESSNLIDLKFVFGKDILLSFL
jgi:hypothetical protein